VLFHPARHAAGLAVLYHVHAKTAAVGSLLTKNGASASDSADAPRVARCYATRVW